MYAHVTNPVYSTQNNEILITVQYQLANVFINSLVGNPSWFNCGIYGPELVLSNSINYAIIVIVKILYIAIGIVHLVLSRQSGTTYPTRNPNPYIYSKCLAKTMCPNNSSELLPIYIPTFLPFFPAILTV